MVKLPAFVICSQTIERFFNKFKQFRAVATRYDNDPDNFLAAIKLISARIWIRSY
jgi:transposase